MPSLEEQLGDTEEQLWAAQAEVRRLQDAIKAAEQAELQARVDAVCVAQETSPDPHALVVWIEQSLWDGSAEDIRGALARVLNIYLLTVETASS